MSITLNLPPDVEQQIRDEAARQGKTVEEVMQERLIADLKHQKIPQSLDDLKPRQPLPPGKTAWDMLAEFPWPGEETDEELQAALKAMD